MNAHDWLAVGLLLLALLTANAAHTLSTALARLSGQGARESAYLGLHGNVQGRVPPDRAGDAPRTYRTGDPL